MLGIFSMWDAKDNFTRGEIEPTWRRVEYKKDIFTWKFRKLVFWNVMSSLSFQCLAQYEVIKSSLREMRFNPHDLRFSELPMWLFTPWYLYFVVLWCYILVLPLQIFKTRLVFIVRFHSEWRDVGPDCPDMQGERHCVVFRRNVPVDQQQIWRGEEETHHHGVEIWQRNSFVRNVKDVCAARHVYNPRR